MQSTGIRYFKKCVIFTFISLIPTTCAFALTSGWHAAAAIGIGGAMAPKTTESKNYPLTDGTYYNYNAITRQQTASFVDGFLGAEYDFSENWGLQFGAGYNQPTVYHAKGTLTQGTVSSSSSYNYAYNIIVRQLMGEMKLLFAVKDQFIPYLFAGAGSAYNTAYHFNTTVPAGTVTREYSKNTSSSFTYSAGFGLDLMLSSQMRIGVGYRFADFGQVALGNATINGTKAPGSTISSRLYANEFLAQVTFLTA